MTTPDDLWLLTVPPSALIKWHFIRIRFFPWNDWTSSNFKESFSSNLSVNVTNYHSLSVSTMFKPPRSLRFTGKVEGGLQYSRQPHLYMGLVALSLNQRMRETSWALPDLVTSQASTPVRPWSPDTDKIGTKNKSVNMRFSVVIRTYYIFCQFMQMIK